MPEKPDKKIDELFRKAMKLPVGHPHQDPALMESYAQACIELAREIMRYKPSIVIVPLMGAYSFYAGAVHAMKEMGVDASALPLFYQIATSMSPEPGGHVHKVKRIIDSIVRARLQRESPMKVRDDLARRRDSVLKKLQAERRKRKRKRDPYTLEHKNYEAVFNHLNDIVLPGLERLTHEDKMEMLRHRRDLSRIEDSIKTGVPKLHKVLIFDELKTGLGIISNYHALRASLPPKARLRIVGLLDSMSDRFLFLKPEVKERLRKLEDKKVYKEIPVERIFTMDNRMYLPMRYLHTGKSAGYGLDRAPNVAAGENGLSYPRDYVEFRRNLESTISEIVRRESPRAGKHGGD